MSSDNSPTWELTMRDTSDPHGHRIRAQQRTFNTWDTTSYRGDEVIATGTIITPPPHQPPVASLMATLESDRQEADYWADRDRS